jgi:Flp pilus assembly secretin CpaC
MFRTLTLVVALTLLGTLHAHAQEPQQVSVSVKVIEFQTVKGVETGLSAYFRQRSDPRPYGRVSSGSSAIRAGDITFPTATTAGITVFLDRLSNSYGDFEIVLQGLVDQNRAYILSRPKAMVTVGQTVPTIIQTTQLIPYEDTTVVGATAVQTTSFRPTGVMLNVLAPRVIDDDGDPGTTEDVYIQLALTAQVDEEGQRITVALDDMLAGTGGIFAQTSNLIRAPEFISRSITTTVWVRHGEVLILGGLYRNTKNKNLSTLPWLTQGEDLLSGAMNRVLPFSSPHVPLTTALGNQRTNEGRRELVFLIKAELWRPSYTVADEFGFSDGPEEPRRRMSPTDVISGVIEGIGGIPQGIAEGVSGEGASEGVSSNLGRRSE